MHASQLGSPVSKTVHIWIRKFSDPPCPPPTWCPPLTPRSFTHEVEVPHVWQVADEVQRQKLDLTETEFALLLQACARGAASWQRVQSLLVKMTKELTRLQPETLAAAEQYFRSVIVRKSVLSVK